MKKFKSILLKIPEFYLLLVAFRIGYIGENHMTLTPFGIILIGVIILQIIFKNNISGFIIAALFSFLSFYMLLAMFSEFSELPSFTPDARNLLVVGLLLFGLNMALAGIMLYKYGRNLGGTKNSVATN